MNLADSSLYCETGDPKARGMTMDLFTRPKSLFARGHRATFDAKLNAGR
jgi:hypothetical protein